MDLSNVKYIVIPDVHGRSFWKEPVKQAIDAEVHIIFLGDYVDPYGHENISRETAIDILGEIIELKKSHCNMVHLLIGNHDLHYIDDSKYGCRMDIDNRERIMKMFLDDFDCFRFMYSSRVNGKNFLFSHAGFLVDWLTDSIDELGYAITDYENEVDYLKKFNEFKDSIDFDFINKFDWKEMWNEKPYWKSKIAEASYSRGGNVAYGSMIWSDVSEHLICSDKVNDCIQIFGHSQQYIDPVRYGDDIYCLDCRKVFAITNDGNVVDENLNELKDNGTEISNNYKDQLKKHMSFFV